MRDFSSGRQPIKRLCTASTHTCKIKLRRFDKTRHEVALLICFLVDHFVLLQLPTLTKVTSDTIPKKTTYKTLMKL
jgi:hypothetical protein